MNRRSFVTTSAASIAAAASPQILAANSKVTKAGFNIAIIGCGGRGTGAAANALNVNKNNKLIAIGELNPDKANAVIKRFKRYKERFTAEQNTFIGFDAIDKICAMPEVDIVVLATTPYFRAEHIEKCIAAGKHIFAEKPFATTSTGLKRIIAASKEAKKKKLAMVTGLCYRFHTPKTTLMPEILEKDMIGKVQSVFSKYYSSGLWSRGRKAGMGDVEYQIHNWPYFAWTGGDQPAEQAIHSIDKISWAMGDAKPQACYAEAGRQTRTDKAFGHVFDHWGVVFDYKDGRKASLQCHQCKGLPGGTEDVLYGTNGKAEMQGAKAWELDGKQIYKHKKKPGEKNMYDQEHKDMQESILAGKPLNNSASSVISTGMAIMARISGYTGRKISWDDMMSYQEDIAPKEMKFEADFAEAPVAKPGTGNWDAYVKSLK